MTSSRRIDFIQASVETLFKFYDDDDSGFLDRSEVKNLLNDICSDLALSKLEDHQLKKFLHILDENNDNEITLDELQENLEHVKTLLK